MRYIRHILALLVAQWQRRTQRQTHRHPWFVRGAWPVPRCSPTMRNDALAWRIAQHVTARMPAFYQVWYCVPWSMIVSGVSGHSLRTMLPIPDRATAWCDIALCSPQGRLITVILVYRGELTERIAHTLSTVHVRVWVVYPAHQASLPSHLLMEP